MNPYRYISLIIGISLCLCFYPQVNVKNYTTNTGLPTNEWYDIKKDRFGQIWVAGDRGVIRYNGNEFKLFDITNGLKYSLVTQIMDMDGIMSFLQYSGDVIQQSHNNQLEPAPYLKDSINKSVVFKYISCYNYNKDLLVLSHLSNEAILINRKTNKVLKQIKHIIEDTISKFLVTETHGLKYAIYVSSPLIPNKDFFHFEINLPGLKRKYRIKLLNSPNPQYSHFLSRKSGGFICSKGNYVFEVNALGEVKIYQSDKQILKFIETENNALMVAYRNGGLRIYKPNAPYNSEPEKILLPELTVTGACTDNENGLWVSTHDNGIFHFPETHTTYTPLLSTVNRNSEVTMVGTEHYLNYSLPSGKNCTLNSDGLMDSTTLLKGLSLIRYKGKCIYYGASGCFSYEKGKLLKLHDFNLTCFTIYKNYFLSGGHGVIFSLNIQNGKVAEHKCIKGRISALTITNDSQLVYGTNFGIFRINTLDALLNDEQTSFETKSIPLLPDSTNERLYVKDIVSYKHKLYIATVGSGLYVLSENKTQYLTTQNGLPSNNIEDLELVKDKLYMASYSGICSVDLSEPQLKVKDIIASYEFSTLDARKIVWFNGFLWVLHSKGIGKLKVTESPDARKPYEPKTYISSISINGKQEYYLSDTLTISKALPSDSHIEVNYFAVSMKMAGRVNYLYRLKGIDEQWKQTHSRYLTFAQLPAGNYRLEIKAVNDNFIPSRYTTSFTFVIQPPFYKTTWFIIIVTLLMLGILFATINVRLKLLRSRINFNLINQKAMVAQINPHFVFNILNSINSDILIEDKKNASKTLINFSKLMRQNLNNSNQKMVSITDDLEALKYYLILEQNRNNLFDYEIKIDPLIDSAKIIIPPMLIQPFVENCIRYAFVNNTYENRGLICIHLNFTQNNLLCVIEDNGIGIETSKALKKETTTRKSYGIQITTERIIFLSKYYKLNPHLKITDLTHSNKQGTRIEFYIPYKNGKDTERDYY